MSSPASDSSAAALRTPQGPASERNNRPTNSGGFAALGLARPLLKALSALGYQSPTEIQQQAIPALVSGRDVTGVAQTGTGKTAAFGLPLLGAIDPDTAAVQALVLVPTRELALQVTSAIRDFARELPTVKITTIYGGAPIGKQISALRHGSQVVVGTPGRVIDLLDRKALKLSALRFAILDEADEMLRMGFAEDVDHILSMAPDERQTALFSATMPSGIRRVAAQHLHQPVDVSVAASATPVHNITQRYNVLPFRHKTLALQRILTLTDADAAVVFVRTRSACELVGGDLTAAGFKSAVISGDISQHDREQTIERLRSGQVDVLVATDVAARGMDVQRIGLVVNFDAPMDPETYVHRIGRTGRAGRSGEAITFFTPKEGSKRKAIERAIGGKLTEAPLPTAAQVSDHHTATVLQSAVDRYRAGSIDGPLESLRAASRRTEIPLEVLAAALLATATGNTASDRDAVDELADLARSDRHRTSGSNKPYRKKPRAHSDRSERRASGSKKWESTKSNRPGKKRHGNDDRSYTSDRDTRSGGKKTAGHKSAGYKAGRKSDGYPAGGPKADRGYKPTRRGDHSAHSDRPGQRAGTGRPRKPRHSRSAA